MRPILVSVAVLFLAAACSGTGGSTAGTAPKAAANIDPAVVTPEYVASLPRDQAEAAISSIRQTYFRQALGRCPDDDVDNCFSKQLEAAFAQSGELAPLCKVNGTGKEYQICLMSAAETVPMVTAAGGNPATDIDWSDVDGTNNAGRRQFAKFIIEKCGNDEGCLIDQAATLLGLSPTVGKSCQLHETLSDRMSCVTDAQSAEVYQRALKSLS